MHPSITHELAQARAADLSRQAQRDVLASAARRTRRQRPRRAGRGFWTAAAARQA
jgi:hypothetical protein